MSSNKKKQSEGWYCQILDLWRCIEHMQGLKKLLQLISQYSLQQYSSQLISCHILFSLSRNILISLSCNILFNLSHNILFSLSCNILLAYLAVFSSAYLAVFSSAYITIFSSGSNHWSMEDVGALTLLHTKAVFLYWLLELPQLPSQCYSNGGRQQMQLRHWIMKYIHRNTTGWSRQMTRTFPQNNNNNQSTIQEVHQQLITREFTINTPLWSLVVLVLQVYDLDKTTDANSSKCWSCVWGIMWQEGEVL